MSRKTVIVPATGHEDTDNDGKCDLCSEKITGADICPLCGKVHYSNTFFGFITAFFHSIAAYVLLYLGKALQF